MQIELQNPISLLSLNILGFGIDVTYGHTPESHTLTVCANFAFGCWSKVWFKDKKK